MRGWQGAGPMAMLVVAGLMLGGCGRDGGDGGAAGPTIEVPRAGEDADEAPTEGLTPAAAATRDALRAAAAAGDWEAVATLLPADPEGFTASFGGADDPIAFYRALPEDLLPEVVALLDGPSARLGDLTVWPELHARTPFAVADEERAGLEGRFGAEAVRTWEEAGAYLGWRIGIQDDGTWRFLVAGD